MEQLEWFRGEILRLIGLGVLRKIKKPRRVSKVFLVPKGINKFRMVVDLVFLNAFSVGGTAEVEPLEYVREFAAQGDVACSLDLSDGYYHFFIHPEATKYFQFVFENQGYEIVALNMGWTLSPGVFTDFLRPVTAYLREQGLRMGWYLDDFLIVAGEVEQCAAHRDLAVATFRKLGLTIREEKCHWYPTHRIHHLGLDLDLLEGEFRVGEKKLAALRTQAKVLLALAHGHNRRVPKRQLARFAGLAQFCYLAVRQARLRLRSLYDVMATTDRWSGQVVMSRQALTDLRWWVRLKGSVHNGGPIWKPVESAVLHTDASPWGWGGTIRTGDHKIEARGFWEKDERHMHITQLELRAVQRVLETGMSLLRERHLHIYTDNMAVKYVMTTGTSRSRAMMGDVRRIYRLLDANAVTLHLSYIPSKQNAEADRLSRCLDTSDWKLNPKYLRRLERWHGTPHTVDRFASTTNTQLPRFNALHHCPQVEAVDSLSLSDDEWRKEVNWINPPWKLLLAVIRKIKSSGAAATVIAPYLPHTLYFALLREMCIRVTRIQRSKDLFTPGRPVANIEAPPWDVAAFTIPLAPKRRPPAWLKSLT